MPKQAYALEHGGLKRLRLSWKGTWREVAIALDGEEIGKISGPQELQTGKEFRLPDDSILTVQLVHKLAGTELRLLRDGQALPGTAADPVAKFKTAYVVIYLIAALNIVLGLVGWLFDVQFLLAIGIGQSSIAFGLLFLGLGFFAQRRSVIALVLAVGIFALDGILSLIVSIAQGYAPNMLDIFVRVLLLVPMIQGITALRGMKKQG
jgi:hypothetical protein